MYALVHLFRSDGVEWGPLRFMCALNESGDLRLKVINDPESISDSVNVNRRSDASGYRHKRLVLLGFGQSC